MTRSKQETTVSRRDSGLPEHEGIAGLRLGQLLVVASGGTGAVVTVVARGPFVVACAQLFGGVALAVWPLRGRHADQWGALLVTYWSRCLSGRRLWRNDAPLLGHVDIEPPRPTLPTHVRGLRLLSTSAPGGGAMGVVRDGLTYTAVLAVRPQRYVLFDTEDRTRRMGGWGRAVARFAGPGNPVARLQWVARTIPTGGFDLPWDADGEGGSGIIDLTLVPGSRSGLVDGAPAGPAHETYVAVQIDARRAPRLVRAGGGGDDGALAVLRREVAALADHLAGAEVVVDGPLPPRLLARVVRVAFDPGARSGLTARTAADPERTGVAPEALWPAVTDDGWAVYRAGTAHHAVYWVEEWPRLPVHPGFLTPLLLDGRCVHTVSLTVEPPSMAGTAPPEVSPWGEDEPVEGRPGCRFSGYVAVAGPDRDTLDDACSEVELLAQQCGLQLARLHGRQAEAFTWTLPLCRGLR